MKTYVSGIGIVSAIGLNAEENLHALKSKTTGIKHTSDSNVLLAQVKLTNKQIIEKFRLPVKEYSRTTLLALHAAKEAWGKNKNHNKVRTGLISATSTGGLDCMEKIYIDSKKNEAAKSNRRMIFENGGITEHIAKELGISGFIGTISTACSSGANAIMQGARLIQGNKLDRVIVGGSDALALFNIKGFSSLNIYDQDICKPFDENRKGLNLGEGAGFLILENEHSLAITGNTPLCSFSGWNNATDAYHQTAISAQGKGAYLTMTKALSIAGLNPEHISYINAHGTGTINNDLSESMALKNVFGDKMPPFSSTKGYTGHTLAAAGAIEAVFCVLAIVSQTVLPNLNFLIPIKETGMIPELNFSRESDLINVLSNSFGFGGNCTSLIFSKL